MMQGSLAMRRMCDLRPVLFLLMAIAVAVISTSVSGQIKDEFWNQIPNALKVHMNTTSYSGSRELSIMCYAVTDQTVAIMGWSLSKAEFEEALGGHCMIVFVAPDGNQYFWPTSFDYTQGYSQYGIGLGDYRTISDSFSGGQLRSGTVARGLIRVPDGIDTSRVFTIWYDDESASLGPVDFGDAGLGPSAQLILELELGHLPQTVARGDAVLIHVTTTASANCTLTLYTSDGIVESTALAPRRASSEGDVTWIWSTDSQTPLGLVMLHAAALLDDQSAEALGSFVVQAE